jgi:hypothetical protein
VPATASRTRAIKTESFFIFTPTDGSSDSVSSE